MPVFTAAATFVASAVGVTSAFGVAAINFGVRVLATGVVSSLIANRLTPKDASPPGSQPNIISQGSRIQASPATDNKLGIVYGSAFVSPIIVDAKISEDQKIMWWVLALTERTDTGSYTLGDIDSATTTNVFWGDKQLIFADMSDRTKVTSWIDSNGDTDTKVAGNLFVYLYDNGSSSPVNSAVSAITVMSDAQIASDQRWNSSRYTSAGKSPTMYRTVFAVIKMIYNQDAGITSLPQIKIKVTNSLTKPGDVIYDYLSNSRYGCGIDINQIDSASLDYLNDYSDVLITYTPVGGGIATQPRYRINGPVSTGQNCLTNIQDMIDSCDSWLQWNEKVAKWSVIPNRSYTDYTTYNELFIIDDFNISSGVNISPVDLNSTYNVVESQFPNTKIADKTDYSFVYLPDEDMNPNEPNNKLIATLPLVNNSVQAQYLATRRLIQSREDLVVNFSMDYSGIQIDAGDVVRVRHQAYGWGPLPDDPGNPDKLFLVSQVQESKSEDGQLGAQISLMEYNEQVYQNIDIDDYNPAANTGLTNPSIVGTPAAPTISNISFESNTFTVDCVIPSVGQVIAMEFWYGPTPTIIDNNYRLWDTQTNSSTPVYAPGSLESSNVVGFAPDTYYWAVRAVTQTTKSNFSNTVDLPWTPSQPPTITVCESTTSASITYSDVFKLWAPNTRGTALNCDYTPANRGSDVGGSAGNLLQIDINISEYAASGTDGLVAEVWTGVDSFNGTTTQGMAYGPNGYILAVRNVGTTGSSVYMCGTTIVRTPAGDPNEYSGVTNAVTIANTILQAATASGTTYVVVGTNAKVYYSTTGYNGWTAATLPGGASGKDFTDVLWISSLSLFVAVGGTLGATYNTGTAYIITSSDGITWTERMSTTSSNILYAVNYNGTTVAALGAGFYFASSSNALSWSASFISGGSAYEIFDLIWSAPANLWVCCGTDGTNSTILTADSALTTFTPRYTGYNGGALYAVAVYDGATDQYFAAGALGEIVSSTNGTGWMSEDPPYTGTYFVCKQFSGVFYIFGESLDYEGTYTSPWIGSVANSGVFDLVNFWPTIRIWSYGSNPTDAYDTTIQPAQDRLPNNSPVTGSFRTGLYYKDVLQKFFLVAGNLNNPSTPVTVYASRKRVAITEFVG
jgi:hypothetical protein